MQPKVRGESCEMTTPTSLFSLTPNFSWVQKERGEPLTASAVCFGWLGNSSVPKNP
jgi:hypothetical protein